MGILQTAIPLATKPILFIACFALTVSTFAPQSVQAAINPQDATIITKATQQAGCKEFQRIQSLARNVGGPGDGNPISLLKHYQTPTNPISQMQTAGQHADSVINTNFMSLFSGGPMSFLSSLTSMFTSGNAAGGVTGPRQPQQAVGQCPSPSYNSPAVASQRHETRAVQN